MSLTCCQHGVRKHVVLLGLVLSITASLFSPSTAAQACDVVKQGQGRGKCANPGAACKSGGLQGVCTNSGVKGEYECACKTVVNCALNVCPGSAPLANHLFYINDLGGGRCIDAGPPQSWAQGSPLFINACNHTAGEEIRVTEIDHSYHDVILSVALQPTNAPPNAQLAAPHGATNAVFCIGVQGGRVVPTAMLELQTCNPPSAAQRFAVDGDAILMGSQTTGKVTRDFVIERQNGSTVPQTPLVVATRDRWEEEPLPIDARYFQFEAVDGSGAAPTSGFLTVADAAHLSCAAQCGWGTVVQILDDGAPLDISAPPAIGVVDGTTIRGYRSRTYQGPEIRTCSTNFDEAFDVFGHDIRFTGLRLLGPNGTSGCGQNATSGDAIDVEPSGTATNPVLPSFWIDHMEVANWPGATVQVGAVPSSVVISRPPPYPNAPYVRVTANFLHDNVYGSGTGGLFTQIRANVFDNNSNQPVTSRVDRCEEGYQGYAAMDNLFLSEHGPSSSDDVDMHGNENPGNWYNGVAGDYFDVGSNTFLATDTGNYLANVNQRGAPCRFTKIHDNVFLQRKGQAIHDPCSNCNTCISITIGVPPTSIPFCVPSWGPPIEYNDKFNAQDPTLGTLLVGDFDADQIDDVFLATGAAWYYSSGGRAEWRFLNRMVELAPALLLGDFDGDGRADVLTVHGPNIDVSWAGVSTWQTINTTTWPLSNLAVGDFDGDGRSDLLLATGRQWLFASGGQNWAPFADHPDTIPNLRFGHFTKKNKTQILRLENSHWQVTELGTSIWTDIGPAPVGLDSVSGLVAGDFDGQGYTELATSVIQPHGRGIASYLWLYTSPGHNARWSDLGGSVGPIALVPIGRFGGSGQAGEIQWLNNSFSLTQGVGAQSTTQLLSRQLMR